MLIKLEKLDVPCDACQRDAVPAITVQVGEVGTLQVLCLRCASELTHRVERYLRDAHAQS